MLALYLAACHTPEAATTVFKCSWGWKQKASETRRVLLQLLINILPSCSTLVFFYVYYPAVLKLSVVLMFITKHPMATSRNWKCRSKCKVNTPKILCLAWNDPLGALLQADLKCGMCALRILGVLYRSSRYLVMGRVQRTRTVIRARLTEGNDVANAFVNLITCVWPQPSDMCGTKWVNAAMC